MAEFVFKIDCLSKTVSVINDAGNRLTHLSDPTKTVLWANVGLDKFPLVIIDAHRIRVQSWNGGVMPLYYRKDGSAFTFSNYPHPLVQHGQVLQVSAQILSARLFGGTNQLYDPVVSFPVLQESSIYILNAEGIDRIGSSLSYRPDANIEQVQDHLIKRFRQYAEEDRDLFIPLSGGYDSRLSLVLALHGGQASERIFSIHERKNDEEQKIALEVARQAGVRITVVGRDDALEAGKDIAVDAFYILRSGVNRDNLRRWTHHIRTALTSTSANARLIGFGAEPHKGKFYRQFSSLSDAKAVFSVGNKRVNHLAGRLANDSYIDYANENMSLLINQASDIYSDLYSQIDYLHYYTYVVQCYGYRCRYFSDEFGADFPQFDTDFLANVFSLKRDDKEAFKINRLLMERLGGELADIPFISANQKSIEKLPVYLSLYKRLVGLIGPKSRKGQRDDIALAPYDPMTKLTSNLLSLLRDDSFKINRNCCITAFNYFTTLEKNYAVDFEMV